MITLLDVLRLIENKNLKVVISEKAATKKMFSSTNVVLIEKLTVEQALKINNDYLIREVLYINPLSKLNILDSGFEVILK